NFLDEAVWFEQLRNRAQEMSAGDGFRAFLFPRAAPDRIIGNLNLTQVHRGETGKPGRDRKSTRLNCSHGSISYAVFCWKKKEQRCSAPRSSAWTDACGSPSWPAGMTPGGP